MATPVDTASGEEGYSLPTLKEIIDNEFNDPLISNEVYSKLMEMEIKDIQTLRLSDDDDLNDLCNDLNLKGAKKIKFKALIRKQKELYQLKHIVTISKKEQKEIDNIDSALKRSDDIHHLLESYFNDIEQHTKNTKTYVNKQFDAMFKALKIRQKNIINNIDEWKLNKSEEVNGETTNIIKYNERLKQIKKEIYTLLSNDRSMIERREKNVQKLTKQLEEENEYYKAFKDIKLIEKYINDKTKLLNVSFQKILSINKLNEVGIININELNDKYAIPLIELYDIVRTTKDDCGYNVKMKWKQQNTDNDNDFVVEYMEEKREWNVLNDLKIKSFDDDIFGVDNTKYLCFGALYRFRVLNIIKKPLNAKIISNIKQFMYNDVININLKSEKQISLLIDCHNGYWNDSYKPQNVLKGNDQLYCSQDGVVNGAMIIFSTKHDAHYHPTKIEVRGWDGIDTIKEFNLWIGNSDNDLWMPCNDTVFTAEQKNGFQSFNLQICNNNNTDNQINKKWLKMKRNQYNHYKLEMISNYGYSYCVGFREFKIFGVEYK